LFVFRLCLCVWFPRWPASRAGNRNKADAELDATSANTGVLRAERWYLQQFAVIELYAVSLGLLRLHI
jgi:hypothetical protein